MFDMSSLNVKGRLFPFIVVMFLIGGCVSNDEYLTAQTLPPIVIPSELDNQAVGQIYTVPEGDGRLATGELKKPLPPTLSASQAITEPRMQSYGDNSWLVVPKESSATWSQLLLFLQSRNIQVIKQDPFSATIETGWISESAEPGTAFRYLVQLEAGLQTELTEIHVINRKGIANTSISRSTVWGQRSDNRSHGEWFLKQIARGLNAQKTLGDSLIASSIQFPDKVISTSVNGEPVLELSLEQGRAFNSVSSSIELGNFNIFDADETRGLVYFTKGKVSKGEDQRKFTQKVKDFLDKISTAKLTRQGLVTNADASYSLDEIIANLPNETEVNQLFPNREIDEDANTLSSVSGYLLIQRLTSDNKQRIYIRDGYGRLLKPSDAKQILDTIRQALI